MDFCGATFDSRLVRPGMLFVALKGEKGDGHDFIPMAREKGAAGIVDGYAELDRVARDYRRSLKAKVIAVTGSAGKTTTKELVKAFLAQAGKVHATAGNFNNHIGLPITILNCPKDADFLVVEMGTNHPGEIAHLCDVAEPDCGLVTNIGTAHLEFFGTQDGIAREKGVLFARAKGVCIAARDNCRLPVLAELAGARLQVVDPAPDWLAQALKDVLPGAHNVANAALAYALAERFGVTRAEAVAALADFALPGARGRRVMRDGVLFIDDTYNANPEAMIAALDAFAALDGFHRKIAILGDMFELGPAAQELHDRVFDYAATRGFDQVIAVGEISSKCRCDARFATVQGLAAAIKGCFRTGDAVLLKASHGMQLGAILI
ncbi:MAG: UDP-N-acetylmuramoyl-tripeptide--D-alanyl-D-alanine ligase [Kiritimatiellia bacterium]